MDHDNTTVCTLRCLTITPTTFITTATRTLSARCPRSRTRTTAGRTQCHALPRTTTSKTTSLTIGYGNRVRHHRRRPRLLLQHTPPRRSPPPTSRHVTRRVSSPATLASSQLTTSTASSPRSAACRLDRALRTTAPHRRVHPPRWDTGYYPRHTRRWTPRRICRL
jgi:hypothetical protein